MPAKRSKGRTINRLFHVKKSEADALAHAQRYYETAVSIHTHSGGDKSDVHFFSEPTKKRFRVFTPTGATCSTTGKELYFHTVFTWDEEESR